MVWKGDMGDLTAIALHLAEQRLGIGNTADQENGCGGIQLRMWSGYLWEKRVERTITEMGEVDSLVGVHLEPFGQQVVIDGLQIVRTFGDDNDLCSVAPMC